MESTSYIDLYVDMLGNPEIIFIIFSSLFVLLVVRCDLFVLKHSHCSLFPSICCFRLPIFYLFNNMPVFSKGSFFLSDLSSTTLTVRKCYTRHSITESYRYSITCSVTFLFLITTPDRWASYIIIPYIIYYT